MSALQWTSGVVLAIAATMALMLGVVCLLYGIYLDEAPRLREQWPLLTQSAALFALLAAVAAAAFHAALRDKPWRWPAQAALALATVATVSLMWRLLVG